MGCATVSAIICSAIVTTGTTYGLGIHTKDIASPNDKSEAIKYTVVAPAWSIICSSFSKLSVLTFLSQLLGVTTKTWHMVFWWGICFVMVSLNIMGVVITRCSVHDHQDLADFLEPGRPDDITYSWAPITLWYTAEMDVFIILGDIPTLWPLFLWFTSKVLSRGGDQSYGIYQTTSSYPRYIESDAFELKDNSNKGTGPATRALREMDNLHTNRTKNPDGSEDSPTDMVKQGDR
ncbi:hypothetical protein E8E14_002252 [Neopestalotiopsis sp. 37M]|nr:hypothetical protein E8E14_002252 [Neopestalotiopsis sp. 37M]